MKKELFYSQSWCWPDMGRCVKRMVCQLTFRWCRSQTVHRSGANPTGNRRWQVFTGHLLLWTGGLCLWNHKHCAGRERAIGRDWPWPSTHCGTAMMSSTSWLVQGISQEKVGSSRRLIISMSHCLKQIRNSSKWEKSEFLGKKHWGPNSIVKTQKMWDAFYKSQSHKKKL